MFFEIMEGESSVVPPGFRFHPTEEELVSYYLARKVASQEIDLDIIQEVDLYRIEPWDLQGQHTESSTLLSYLLSSFFVLICN